MVCLLSAYIFSGRQCELRSSPFAYEKNKTDRVSRLLAFGLTACADANGGLWCPELARCREFHAGRLNGADQCRDGMDLHLGHDAGTMHLDGFLDRAKVARDLFVQA